MRKIVMKKVLSINFLLVAIMFCIIFVIVAYPICSYLLNIGWKPLHSSLIGIWLGNLAAWTFVILTVKIEKAEHKT